MSDDYYELLEVERTADDGTIKSSYRKLAMRFHPDKNPGCAESEAKFKAISEAYDVLKDPQKRAAYDQYGKAAFQNGGGGGPQAYSAAKAAVINLTASTAIELAPYSIRVNAICPGWVLTPLVQKQIDDRARAQDIPVEQAAAALLGDKQPSLQFVTPGQLGELAVFMCSPGGDNVRGVAWNVDGGWVMRG